LLIRSSLLDAPGTARVSVQLAWSLEERGFLITTTEDGGLSVEPRNALTARDKANLERWEGHLSALSDFCDEVVAT